MFTLVATKGARGWKTIILDEEKRDSLKKWMVVDMIVAALLGIAGVVCAIQMNWDFKCSIPSLCLGIPALIYMGGILFFQPKIIPRMQTHITEHHLIMENGNRIVLTRRRGSIF